MGSPIAPETTSSRRIGAQAMLVLGAVALVFGVLGLYESKPASPNDGARADKQRAFGLHPWRRASQRERQAEYFGGANMKDQLRYIPYVLLFFSIVLLALASFILSKENHTPLNGVYAALYSLLGLFGVITGVALTTLSKRIKRLEDKFDNKKA